MTVNKKNKALNNFYKKVLPLALLAKNPAKLYNQKIKIEKNSLKGFCKADYNCDLFYIQKYVFSVLAKVAFDRINLSVYYPGSGSDFYRVFCATDATYFLLVDLKRFYSSPICDSVDALDCIYQQIKILAKGSTIIKRNYKNLNYFSFKFKGLSDKNIVRHLLYVGDTDALSFKIKNNDLKKLKLDNFTIKKFKEIDIFFDPDTYIFSFSLLDCLVDSGLVLLGGNNLQRNGIFKNKIRELLEKGTFEILDYFNNEDMEFYYGPNFNRREKGRSVVCSGEHLILKKHNDK